MEILPNFAASYLANDLAFLHRAATQIAIGEGAISICREFQDLERMMLVDESYEEYICEFPNAVEKIMGRGLTPAQLLQSWFNTKFVTGCRNSRKLVRALEAVKENPVWPDYTVLAERFRVVLTAKEAESQDQEARAGGRNRGECCNRRRESPSICEWRRCFV